MRLLLSDWFSINVQKARAVSTSVVKWYWKYEIMVDMVSVLRRMLGSMNCGCDASEALCVKIELWRWRALCARLTWELLKAGLYSGAAEVSGGVCAKLLYRASIIVCLLCGFGWRLTVVRTALATRSSSSSPSSSWSFIIWTFFQHAGDRLPIRGHRLQRPIFWSWYQSFLFFFNKKIVSERSVYTSGEKW